MNLTSVAVIYRLRPHLFNAALDRFSVIISATHRT
jgi:hypothetical protein